jgi:hypothetical protein
MFNKKIVLTGLAIGLSTSLIMAGNDPSIKGWIRQDIKQAMTKFINDHSVNDIYTHYDPVKGNLHKLQLKKLHSGIVKKGNFYVSCADFKNQEGKVVDIDFMVIKSEKGLFVNQALIHKINKNKRAYHLES